MINIKKSDIIFLNELSVGTKMNGNWIEYSI